MTAASDHPVRVKVECELDCYGNNLEEDQYPLTISHIELVELITRDLDNAEAFYSALGLRRGVRVMPTDRAGGTATFHPARGPGLQIAAEPFAFPRTDGPVVGFEVERGSNLNELMEAVEGAGGEIVFRDIRVPEWLVVGLRDPDGNALELLIPH